MVLGMYIDNYKTLTNFAIEFNKVNVLMGKTELEKQVF